MAHALDSHGLLGLYGYDKAILKDGDCLKTALIAAAQAAEVTILTGYSHTFGDAGGVIDVLLLTESHISIHTWPEYRFATIGAFICGGMELEKVKEMLYRELAVERAVWAAAQHGEGIPDDIQPLVKQ